MWPSPHFGSQYKTSRWTGSAQEIVFSGTGVHPVSRSLIAVVVGPNLWPTLCHKCPYDLPLYDMASSDMVPYSMDHTVWSEVKLDLTKSRFWMVLPLNGIDMVQKKIQKLNAIEPTGLSGPNTSRWSRDPDLDINLYLACDFVTFLRFFSLNFLWSKLFC